MYYCIVSSELSSYFRVSSYTPYMVDLGDDLILFLTPSTLLILNHNEKQIFYVGSMSIVRGGCLKI